MEPTAIELMQDVPGFDRFIASWLCPGRRNVLVDVGPANGVDHLIRSLNALGVDHIDLVLMTHIHIDHAGGLGVFLERFPMARVICHRKGIGHLVDPSKLWAGRRKVLGARAETYGRPRPVPRERLIAHQEASIEGVDIIETPGHAPHHLSFRHGGTLFVGEAGGIYLPLEGMEYLRPATPPVLFLDQFLRSIDRLLDLDDLPICYTHFAGAPRAHPLLRRHREQLIRWEGIIRKERSRPGIRLEERCVERLLEEDPEIRAFERLSPRTRDRERFFMTNSVRGFLGFLAPGTPQSS